MKKFVTFALAAVAALTFPGCMKSGSSWEEIQRVAPGMNIYWMAMNQNEVAMQPANAGMRLAMLVSEALSQDPEYDLTKLGEVTVSGKNVLSKLFNAGMTSLSGTTVEVVDGIGYRIKFDENMQQTSGLILSGSMLVRTGNTPSLAAGGTWTVTPENVTVTRPSTSGSQSTKIIISGGATTIVCAGSTYTISINGFVTHFDEASISSNWSGSFRVTVPDASYTYETCSGKQFEVEGAASGATMYTATETTPLTINYSLESGKYYGMQIVSGTQTCKLPNPFEYSTSIFPADEVTYTWLYNEINSSNTYQVSYNGATWKP